MVGWTPILSPTGCSIMSIVLSLLQTTGSFLYWMDTETQVKHMKAIELARKENVTMLCLPPHTTHKIQPFDRTLFKPLQTYVPRPGCGAMAANTCWTSDYTISIVLTVQRGLLQNSHHVNSHKWLCTMWHLALQQGRVRRK